MRGGAIRLCTVTHSVRHTICVVLPVTSFRFLNVHAGNLLAWYFYTWWNGLSLACLPCILAICQMCGSVVKPLYMLFFSFDIIQMMFHAGTQKVLMENVDFICHHLEIHAMPIASMVVIRLCTG